MFRLRVPADEDARAKLLEIARETRDKIRQVRAALAFYESLPGPKKERRYEIAAEGIAALRRAYRDCRSTFIKADMIRDAIAQDVVRFYAAADEPEEPEPATKPATINSRRRRRR